MTFIRRSKQGQTKSFSLQKVHKTESSSFLVGRLMIAVTIKLHDSFTVRLEAKNSLSGPTYIAKLLAGRNIDFI